VNLRLTLKLYYNKTNKEREMMLFVGEVAAGTNLGGMAC